MDFIKDFFIDPIINPANSGYNLVNTVIYLILMIFACVAIYFLLNKKIKFNNNFLTALLPYILFGISMRVIMHQVEAGLLVSDLIRKTANPLEIGFYFFTPGIWILTFSLVIIGLLISEIWKEIKLKRLFYFGLIIMAFPLIYNLLHFNQWPVFLGVTILIFGVASLVCYLINKFTKYKILNDKLNYFIVIGQGFDGIASAIAIAFFNFSEQHVLSNVIIQIHPGLFVIIKLIIAILICYSLDDYLKENENKEQLVNFVKLIIAILGLATGLASLFKLGII
ncbi:MAG: DUF63 family protein [Candidatus ainarchaeum sp.]|nr:DUF63 family protein [Candidatus ainarchaeum sp.]